MEVWPLTKHTAALVCVSASGGGADLLCPLTSSKTQSVSGGGRCRLQHSDQTHLPSRGPRINRARAEELELEAKVHEAFTITPKRAGMGENSTASTQYMLVSPHTRHAGPVIVRDTSRCHQQQRVNRTRRTRLRGVLGAPTVHSPKSKPNMHKIL